MGWMDGWKIYLTNLKLYRRYRLVKNLTYIDKNKKYRYKVHDTDKATVGLIKDFKSLRQPQ